MRASSPSRAAVALLIAALALLAACAPTPEGYFADVGLGRHVLVCDMPGDSTHWREFIVTPRR